MVITEDQLGLIEMFLSEVREGIEHSTFKDQRKILDLLNVRGKLAIENDKKVIYITCLLNPEPQPVSLFKISHSSNLHWHNPIELTAKCIFEANWSLAEALFSQVVRA